MNKKYFSIMLWVILGITIGYLGTILISDIKFNENVRKKTFDECFNYYSNIDKDRGIDTETINICKDKAKEN